MNDDNNDQIDSDTETENTDAASIMEGLVPAPAHGVEAHANAFRLLSLQLNAEEHASMAPIWEAQSTATILGDAQALNDAEIARSKVMAAVSTRLAESARFIAEDAAFQRNNIDQAAELIEAAEWLERTAKVGFRSTEEREAFSKLVGI